MKHQPSVNVTFIAPGATLEGNLILDHGISLFGIVDGNLISSFGLLHVGTSGLVKGQIDGEHVRVDGTVEGDVHARGSLEINGRVKGNIFYCGTIRLGERASLEGQIKRIARERIIGNEHGSTSDASNVQPLPLAANNA